MNHSEIKEIFQRYYSEVLERAKSRIDKEGPLSKQQVQNIKKSLTELNELIESGNDDELELLGLDTDHPQDSFVHQSLKPIMEKYKLNFDFKSKEYAMMKAANKFAHRNHFKDLLTYNSQAMDYSLLDTPPVNISKNSQHTLARVMQSYLKEIKRTTTSPSSLTAIKNHLNYLVELYGEEYPICNLDFTNAREVKENLQLTPTNKNKKKLTRDKPLIKQIDIAKGHSMETLGTTSINKYLGYFSRFFNWAKKNKYVEENIFEGMAIKSRKKDFRRDKFDKSEIELILKELQENKSGKVKNKSQYWGTLIAIYTGARKNEICGLRVEDVIKDESSGIWYFNITDEEEGKNLKTAAAKRLVPIHSKLLELGFIDYLEQARKIVNSRPKHKGMELRLLYNLTYTKGSNWGRGFGQFINERLLPSLGLYEPNRKTLHSLRHSFVTSLNVEKVSSEVIKSMVGHEQGTVTHGTYTHYGVEHLPQFKEAIEKLPY